MTYTKPPLIATWLLQRFSVNESTIGDLFERYRQRPSSLWYWRQALTTLAVTVAYAIGSDKFITVRAILIGWALLLTLNVIPFGNWFVSLMVTWRWDRIPLWPFEVGTAALWLPTLLFGIATGYLVALVHPRNSMAVVIALACTVAMICLPVFAARAQMAIRHASGPSVLGAVFLQYVVAWTTLTATGILVGGLLGVRPSGASLQTGARSQSC
jgi:hypothetical protein